MTELSKLNQESEEYDFYLMELERKNKCLKQEYAALLTVLERVVKNEERMNRNDNSTLFWTACYYDSVASVLYYLDMIQDLLKDMDKLRNKIKEAF